MARNLSNKVILITGGSSGIGAATAQWCLNQGMSVAITGRRAEKLDEAAKRLGARSDRLMMQVCDVDETEHVEQTVAAVYERFERLDAVFANAGYGMFKTFEETTDGDYDALFNTNFFGTVRTVRAALPKLRQTAEQHPDALKHLLICSSSASEVGIPYFGAYCASKAMQDSIAGALRAELATEGIFVTSVHPIGTKTNFFSAATDRQGDAVDMNTPEFFMQRTEHVAHCIGRAICKPRPEVWPSFMARMLMAAGTAVPSFPARLMRRHAKKIRQSTPG